MSDFKPRVHAMKPIDRHTRYCMACGAWAEADLCDRCTQKLRVTRADYEHNAELEKLRKLQMERAA